MSNLKKLFSKKGVCGIIIFVAAAFILQSCAMLFMTPEGLSVIAPYVLAVKSKRIDGGTAEFGELFSLNNEVKDAGLVILSVDTGVEASYELASDYLRFLCKLTYVPYAVTYVSPIKVRAISEASVAGDHTAFTEACSVQEKSQSLPRQFFRYLESVYSQNSRLTPDAKITVCGIKGYTSYKDVISSLTSELFTAPGGLSGEHTEVMSAQSPEEFVSLMKKHEAALSDILGSKFEMYSESVDAVQNGVVEETFALKNMEKYAPAGSGTVFAVLPDYLCTDDSEFIKGAKEIYGKVCVTDTRYYDCISLESGDEAEHSDGKYPSAFGGIRIAAADELRGFREYYMKVANTFSSEITEERTDSIGQMGERSFFIIVGFGPVTYYDPDEEKAATGTVLVAPGA